MLKKKKTNLVSLLVILSLVMTLSTGCGNSDVDESHNGSTTEVSDNIATDENETAKDNTENESSSTNLNNKTEESAKQQNSGETDSKNSNDENAGYDSRLENPVEFRNYAENMYKSGKIEGYRHKPSIPLNNGKPYFRKVKFTKVYKNYSDLDNLNRVGTCEVVTGPEFLPKEKRGEIDKVHPTGWKQKKYNFVDGKYLYNRCHLIGFQIAGDNANWKNLMTGTRYMNVDGMLPYENDVTQYIKRTKHHVKYRVTPVFLDSDKVARGVIMEAQSLEDNNLQFNVFCYNVQPGVVINYYDGSSKLDK